MGCFVYFLLCPQGLQGRVNEGDTSCCQTISAPGDGVWLFDDILETMMKGSVSVPRVSHEWF